MGQRGGARHALVPAEQLAFAVEDRAQVVHAAGLVIVVVEVLLARPHEAHRLVDGLGHHHGLGHVVVIEPAAIAAADAGHPDIDLRGTQAGQALHHRPRFLRRLGRHDEAGAILVQPHQAIHRLGGDVPQPRLEISSLETARGFLAGGFDIAIVAHARSGIGFAGEQGTGLLLQRIAAFAAAGAGFPFEFEFLAALQRRPGVYGQHRHRRRDHGAAQRLAGLGFQLHYFQHAFDGERIGGVDLRQRAVRPRAMRQHGDQLVAVMFVDRIAGQAGDDGACVDIADRLADQVIVRGIFQQRYAGGQGDLAGVRGKAAVGEAAPVRRDHRAGIATQIAGR